MAVVQVNTIMDEYPDDWNSRRRRVYQRDDYTCQNCGAKGGQKGDAELHAHHIVPKSKGGSHNLNNLKTLCSHCHDTIHEGSLISPKISLGSKKKHLIYLFTTFGIGNIFHALNSLTKSITNKYTAWKRMKRAKYGSLKTHSILFFTTAGIGNVVYYLYKSSKRSGSTTRSKKTSTRYSQKNTLSRSSNSIMDSINTNVVSEPYSNYISSLDWDRYGEYPYEHYTDALEDIKRLKREEKHDEVEDILIWCIGFVEAVSSQSVSQTGTKNPPKAYYEHLAIVYRKEERYDDEVEILQRYKLFCEDIGVDPNEKLIKRLNKAKKYAGGG
jgi:hypothetical protein